MFNQNQYSLEGEKIRTFSLYMLAYNNLVNHSCFDLIFTLMDYKECRTHLLLHISSDRYAIVFEYNTNLYLWSIRQHTNLIRPHVSIWDMLHITATVLHQYWYNKVIFFWSYTDYSILKNSNKLYFRLSDWTPML